MPHPVVENLTTTAFEPVFAADEEGRPIVIAVVRGTFDVPDHGRATFAEEQEPIRVGGTWWGKPGESSLKYEPEMAIEKPATDVVLIATARPVQRETTSLDVGIRLGPVEKAVRVFGPRHWVRRLGMKSISKPEPVEEVPLIAENAFGGWDRTPPDERHHRCEPRNPVGVGFHVSRGTFDEGEPLPAMELAHDAIRRHGQRVEPATFGFTEAHWEPRRRFAGTYDARWDKTRKPLLPNDFDRRFFNAASPGLIAPGHLVGNEDVTLLNLGGKPRWDFSLPGLSPPIVRVVRRGDEDLITTTVLDTIVVDVERRKVLLTWRSHAVLVNGPPDVARFVITPGWS
ncbi:MAG: DUF2169 domain-containing protein [Planctomycetes bacterium]|nr:DUF2169 domain-containing protein [Planctomycetota bacterium]MCB9890880.1 DUF2169 domain-containing protein [Planctomycetota bacterium]